MTSPVWTASSRDRCKKFKMAKYYGKVGYIENTETRPGVWMPTVTERPYYGDIIRNNRRLENGFSVNDDVTLNSVVSIVSDPYALEHMFAIRYVEWMGANWKVTNVEVQSPRLLLTVGGMYSGQTAGTP